MARYRRQFAIGDIQGCLSPLLQLLEQIEFDPDQDRLWFCGDLINRGPQSVETLRFIKALGENAICVLGNHDLHFLAVAEGVCKPKSKDTFDELLAAEDRDELVSWLRHRSLLHMDEELGYVMIHAGIYPGWSWRETQALAREAEAVIHGPGYKSFLDGMYGNQPSCWQSDLSGLDRIRFIINCLTRMRFCNEKLELDLKHKGPPGSQPAGLRPWFDFPQLDAGGLKLLFGHWSTLGPLQVPGLIALDTGCIWGGKLSAYELSSETLHQLNCQQQQKPDGISVKD